MLSLHIPSGLAVLVRGSDSVFPGLKAKPKTDMNLDRLQGKVPRVAFLLQTRPPNTRDSIAKHYPSGAGKYNRLKNIFVKGFQIWKHRTRARFFKLFLGGAMMPGWWNGSTQEVMTRVANHAPEAPSARFQLRYVAGRRQAAAENRNFGGIRKFMFNWVNGNLVVFCSNDRLLTLITINITLRV